MEIINKFALPLGSIIMVLSYLPQIRQIIKTKSSKGVNLLFISMVTLAIMTFTLNGYVILKTTREIGTLLSQLANLIPALTLIIVTIKYKER